MLLACLRACAANAPDRFRGLWRFVHRETPYVLATDRASMLAVAGLGIHQELPCFPFSPELVAQALDLACPRHTERLDLLRWSTIVPVEGKPCPICGGRGWHPRDPGPRPISPLCCGAPRSLVVVHPAPFGPTLLDRARLARGLAMLPEGPVRYGVAPDFGYVVFHGEGWRFALGTMRPTGEEQEADRWPGW